MVHCPCRCSCQCTATVASAIVVSTASSWGDFATDSIFCFTSFLPQTISAWPFVRRIARAAAHLQQRYREAKWTPTTAGVPVQCRWTRGRKREEARTKMSMRHKGNTLQKLNRGKATDTRRESKTGRRDFDCKIALRLTQRYHCMNKNYHHFSTLNGIAPWYLVARTEAMKRRFAAT